MRMMKVNVIVVLYTIMTRRGQRVASNELQGHIRATWDATSLKQFFDIVVYSNRTSISKSSV